MLKIIHQVAIVAGGKGGIAAVMGLPEGVIMDLLSMPYYYLQIHQALIITDHMLCLRSCHERVD